MGFLGGFRPWGEWRTLEIVVTYTSAQEQLPLVEDAVQIHPVEGVLRRFVLGLRVQGSGFSEYTVTLQRPLTL